MNPMREYKNLTWKGSRERPIVMDVLWNEGEKKLPVVILAHGYKGFKDWGAWNLVAKKFSDAGFLFIKFNFSYNGGTLEQPIDFPDLQAFGENNYSTEVADFKRVIDFVHQSNIVPRDRVDLSDITIIGHSRGGGMAILTADQDERVDKLITLASICDLERRRPTGEALAEFKRTGVIHVKNSRTNQMMPHFYQMHEDYVTNSDKLNVKKAAEGISIPWLIIHGTSDTSVPYSEAEELKESNKEARLVSIENANHVFGAGHPWNESSMPEDLKLTVEACLDFL